MAAQPSKNMRRVVRFHPATDDEGNYDANTICTGLLKDNVEAQVGSTATVFEGNLFDPTSWTMGFLETKIGKLLIPVDPIPNIYCIGLNYKKHADESKMAYPEEPVIFMKPTSSLCNPNESILIPQCCLRDEVDYEVELVIVISKKCKNVSKEDALKYILGYTIANDVSARNWQLKRGGSQWIRGKSFDTFSPIGPCLLIQESNENAQDYSADNLKLWTDLSDQQCNNVNEIKKNEESFKRLQNSSTNDLIHKIKDIVSFVSKSTTLLPGTVIFTGTPEGVGFARNPKVYLKNGQTVIVGVEHIGQLVNTVKDEPINSKI